jgi:pimeloyl-ACP methyl ester carboxylesterase
LVVIDGRGPGQSDKPRGEAFYRLEQRVADATAALDVGGIERTHFWGYLMFPTTTHLRAADAAVYAAGVPTGPDMQGMLGSMSMPCCLCAGDEDPVFPQTKRAGQLIMNSRSLTFSGLRHLPAFTESSVVLSPVAVLLGSLHT